MSGSLASIYQSVSYALQLHGRSIVQLQEQTATGNAVNRGSDSPANAYRILGLNSQERSLESHKQNVIELTGNLQISSTIISDMAGQLADSRTLLTQIVSGVHDTEGQRRIADKLNNTLEQLVSLANTKHANQYLFGGNNTAIPPYVVTREGGHISEVRYQGSHDIRRVDVAPGMTIESYHVGDEIFRSKNRQDPVFLGETGIAAGTGTSSVAGNVWLTVDHDGSNYRVSIDDGATFVTVPAGGSANQAVTDSRTGQVLYVDTTGITETGVELVRVPGTYDAFNSLIQLRDLLNNDQGLAPRQVLEYANECVAAVEEVRYRLVQVDVSTGSTIGFLTSLERNIENMQFDTEDEATRLQQADIAQIAIDLSRREVLYQMSLSVAGKLMTTSLLDFLR
jgi:flagellar hook-associated protein 3 FlgL